MLRDSVVTRTGQRWKLALAILPMLVGGFAPLFDRSGMSWTEGMILATLGSAYGYLFIRCPSCGNRWFWAAALDALLYKPLMTAPTCPSCKREFGRR